MALKDFLCLFHRGKRDYALYPEGSGGIQPVMRQRPLIDAGNTGRYFLDAFAVKFDSPVGGGTIPLANPPGIPTMNGGLRVTPYAMGIYGGMGSIPQLPGTQPLIHGFRDGGL